MYVVIVGAGKVGWNLARELIQKENEVTLVESDPQRYAVVEEELEHNVQYGDGSELWVLERAGIERAQLVIEIIELEVAPDSPAAGKRVKELGLPDGTLVISVLRDGGGFVPTGDSVVEA